MVFYLSHRPRSQVPNVNPSFCSPSILTRGSGPCPGSAVYCGCQCGGRDAPSAGGDRTAGRSAAGGHMVLQHRRPDMMAAGMWGPPPPPPPPPAPPPPPPPPHSESYHAPGPFPQEGRRRRWPLSVSFAGCMGTVRCPRVVSDRHLRDASLPSACPLLFWSHTEFGMLCFCCLIRLTFPRL